MPRKLAAALWKHSAHEERPKIDESTHAAALSLVTLVLIVIISAWEYVDAVRRKPTGRQRYNDGILSNVSWEKRTSRSPS